MARKARKKVVKRNLAAKEALPRSAGPMKDKRLKTRQERRQEDRKVERDETAS